MTDRNYYLMRSPKELINDNLIGYGWEKVNFSKFRNTSVTGAMMNSMGEL